MGVPFYHNNEVRGYPFDDSATRVDDLGIRMPVALLSDMSIAFPESYGFRVFCSAMSKTPEGAAFVFSADNPERTVLAIGTVGTEVVPRRPVALVPMQEYVKGTFVPGEDLCDCPPINLRFSDPSQSVLAARVGFPLPVTGSADFAAFYSSDSFHRIVELIAAGDLTVRIENKVLGGVTKRAIVFRLAEFGSDDNSNLARYSATLPRPESRTCGDPQPLELLAGVRPDCCGRVFIELRGCAQPIPISNLCGVSLDCPHESNSLCSPDVDYDLPEDDCVEQGVPDPLNPPPNLPQLPPWWNDWRV